MNYGDINCGDMIPIARISSTRYPPSHVPPRPHRRPRRSASCHAARQPPHGNRFGGGGLRALPRSAGRAAAASRCGVPGLVPDAMHLILTSPKGDAAAAGADRRDAGGLALAWRRGASRPPRRRARAGRAGAGAGAALGRPDRPAARPGCRLSSRWWKSGSTVA